MPYAWITIKTRNRIGKNLLKIKSARHQHALLPKQKLLCSVPTDKCHFYASLTAYLHLILSILRSIVTYSSLSLSWIRLHSFILCLQGKCLHLWGRVEGALEQVEQDSQWKKRDWDFGHLWDWSEAKPLPTEPMLMPNCLILQQSPALLPPTTGEKRNRTQNTTAAQDKRAFFRLLYFQIVPILCCESVLPARGIQLW